MTKDTRSSQHDFPFKKLNTGAEPKQKTEKLKAKWDAIQTELQIMKNESLDSCPHDATTAQIANHKHTQTLRYSYTYKQIYM